MAMNDALSNALSKIYDNEKTGKKEVIINPSTKVIIRVLDLMSERDSLDIDEPDDFERAEFLMRSK